jgi:hypothetical protein
MSVLNITLTYTGRAATRSEIDLYDVGQALVGFQRSLALTTHLILNDEIITQAPSLKGAEIIALPAEEGSWKITAAVIAALYTAGTAPKDTPVGHLIRSAYDYVISETLGFHVDYDKTIGQSYEEIKKKRVQEITPLPQTRFDSLIEKCQTAIREMHRPIVRSETATQAKLTTIVGQITRTVGRPFTSESYEYINFTEQGESPSRYVGWVSSYNINTYKGRVYVPKHQRPIPFELAESTRSRRAIGAITSSLSANAQSRRQGEGSISFDAFENRSRSGQLKSLFITRIDL